MSDLIERQKAIRKLKRMATQAYIDKLNGSAETVINCCIDVIERQIPPAQPEIVRCKDCKSLQKWRSEESAKKFGQIYECARGVFLCPKPEDFCSWAERRTDG